MGVAPIGTSGFLTSAQIRAIAKKNEILLYRNGNLVGDFGDTRVTAQDFATGINAALAASQPGDTLHTGPITAAGNITVSTDNLRWIADDTKIVPVGTSWSNLLWIAGSDIIVEGITVDGQGTSNNGSGTGIRIDGDRAQLLRSQVHRTRGLLETDGSGILVIGADDVLIDGLYSDNVQYSTIRSNTCDRPVFRNVRVINCIGRSFNLEGSKDLQSVTLENWDVSCVIPGTWATWNWNIPTGYKCESLFLRNCRLHQGDVVSPGYSWNNSSGYNLSKFQSIDSVYMDGVRMHHGSNAGTGFSISFRFEDSAFGGPVRRMFIDNSHFAGGFTFNGQKPEILSIRNSEVGYRQCDTTALIFSALCEEFLAENVEFNMHAATRVMTMSGLNLATDRYRFRNCRFLANKAGNAYIVDSAIKANVGRMENSTPVFTNPSGTWTRSSGTGAEYAELGLTTDQDGVMLFDPNIVGTGAGKHPAPGASAPYFSGMAVPSDGARIRNTRWTTGVSEWHSNSGQWKQRI